VRLDDLAGHDEFMADRDDVRYTGQAGYPHAVLIVGQNLDLVKLDLPVGVLTRTPWGRYPEYHTSADNLSFIAADALAGSLAAFLATAAVLEEGARSRGAAARRRPGSPGRSDRWSSGLGRRFRNLLPFGEPRLGPRGLYGSLGGGGRKEKELALLWVLNQSDGHHSLVDISGRSGLPRGIIEEAAELLVRADLLEEIR